MESIEPLRGMGAGIFRVPSAEEVTQTEIHWIPLELIFPSKFAAKRAFDVVLAALFLVVTAPLFLLIIAAIRLTSRGPAFFFQRRIGYRCAEFDMIKFRTMVDGAQALEPQLLPAGSAFFKLRRDPRVTVVGEFLRRFSLDELPQLINVLNGSMSLVGPRPLLLSDLAKFSRRKQMRRFSVKPGMTGLWQVSGRSKCTDSERLELDREYVNEWRLRLDLKILLKTVRVVLTGEGAS
jgi:lipopolysaccharide/colanic/teichoic acid biosynthesis glycosyltransferase